MSSRRTAWGAIAALTLIVASGASARPQYLARFKAHYNTASGKPTLNAANCGLCHIGSPAQKTWNAYGEALRTVLAGATNVQDNAKIDAALDAAAQANAPGGGKFVALINADKMPGAAAAPTGIWVPAFNGANMEGWTNMNQGNWVVQNGLLRYTGGGNGWLRTNKQYKNYAAVIVWKYAEPGNNDSGIFLRATSLDGSPWPNSPQLNMGPGENFGSVGGAQGTRNRHDLIKPTDWNVYQIMVHNGKATLAINGQPAWTGAATGIADVPGYIGIQAENRPLDISRFWIMELP
jgi:hypothetical protein